MIESDQEQLLDQRTESYGPAKLLPWERYEGPIKSYQLHMSYIAKIFRQIFWLMLVKQFGNVSDEVRWRFRTESPCVQYPALTGCEVEFFQWEQPKIPVIWCTFAIGSR